MSESEERALRISAEAVACSLAAGSLLLVLLAVVGQYYRWQGVEHYLIGQFDLDAEKNPPAPFAAFLLFLSAVLSALVAHSERRGKWVRHWQLLAIGFLVMSIDEAFSFHEKLIESTRRMLGDDYPLIFHFAWVVPGMALVAALAVAFLGFLRALPASTRRRYVVAALTYLGGAVGMEMIGGRYYALYGSDFPQSLIAIAEEGMEMIGVCIFIHATLRHLADSKRLILLRFA
jgi:hypothetical protein